MTDFTVYTPDNAPGKSGELLDGAMKKMGFLPNLYAMLAESDAALEAHFLLSSLVSKTGFSQAEQQLILLTASVENECNYCVAAHSSGARMAKLDKEIIEAVRTGNPIADERLEALRQFTGALVEKRGHARNEMEAFLAAGFSKQNALEVVLCVPMKTLSNYTNHLAGIPLDSVLSRMEWNGKDELQQAG
ncbi:MAG: carboxymuconolactone decarboxylase family protein [Hyphomicrobiales bacterium]|nr:carboxymuconolactone decarboxylase family protein [Hyphomicrobiales bacterium]MCP4997544.1 carboxymuconolactone decarboxylase family protein [Hyphomicrobiales bacterium]